MDPERERLQAEREQKAPWKRWGPYLAERQWGTVREDYSRTGDAWGYFTFEQSHARAYRWGEDGIAGISDDQQRLCFALALWNGRDPLLKERIFGLTNAEGNHGEDAKEYYFYLDSTPTHSYMKFLYKYPQAEFPYDDLLRTNRLRTRFELEYELLDTGVFDEDRYFDVFVEYAKAAPEDLLIRITAWNRGPDPAPLDLLPTLWFRNTWAWHADAERPCMRIAGSEGRSAIAASHEALGEMFLHCDGGPPLLFTENDTNLERVFGRSSRSPYAKDAFHAYVVGGQPDAVNPAGCGTKAAAHYAFEVPAGGSQEIRLRLTNAAVAGDADDPFAGFNRTFTARRIEADMFYDRITPVDVSADARDVMRQAFAGMLWTKQYYLYRVDDWLEGDAAVPEHPEQPPDSRNRHWFHLESSDIISMPDKWEYPWFAAWDLAFHAIVLARIDPDFAKHQMALIIQQYFIHPNGQLPAYEWNFGDVNPPVHASATWQVYLLDKAIHKRGDTRFLEAVFQKLLVNFTWWVNRKDRSGQNVFEGGFLGLDNIGVFDRSKPLPTGGHLEQADGTSWMAVFALDMLTMALELSLYNPVYEDMASKFYEHFIYIAAAMDRIGSHDDELWDDEDGFFYDVLRLPSAPPMRLKVRSMVGLVPLFAVAIFTPKMLERLPRFRERMKQFNRQHPELLTHINKPEAPGAEGRLLLSIVDEKKLRRILTRMLDESEFLSDYGIRSLSRHHRDDPYILALGREVYRVDYEPAESTTSLFGGNSNWRGPIWYPVNAMIVYSLAKLYAYFGDTFQIECPTGSGVTMNLMQVQHELTDRLVRIFLREDGRRPVYGATEKFQTDPHWRDLILFYEYFHGDNGAGIGASHQTGWTGLVARFVQMHGTTAGGTSTIMRDYVELLTQYAGFPDAPR